MTFAELQQELSEVLAESSTRTFTTTQRKRWINRGVVEVCRLTRCLRKEVTKNIVAGDNTYDLVADWSLTDFIEFAPEGIVVKDSAAEPSTRYTPLERRTVEWLDENVPGWRMTDTSLQSDSLQYYARLGKTVYIYPTPQATVIGGFRVTYHYYPVQGTTVGGLVNDSDVPFDGWPDLEPYHYLPVLYAGWRALLKAGVPKAQVVLQEFRAGIEEMKRDLRRLSDYEPQLRVFQYRAR